PEGDHYQSDKDQEGDDKRRDDFHVAEHAPAVGVAPLARPRSRTFTEVWAFTRSLANRTFVSNWRRPPTIAGRFPPGPFHRGYRPLSANELGSDCRELRLCTPRLPATLAPLETAGPFSSVVVVRRAMRPDVQDCIVAGRGGSYGSVLAATRIS